ncbi:hypothetical protein D3C72_1754700 [compost metagenome]
MRCREHDLHWLHGNVLQLNPCRRLPAQSDKGHVDPAIVEIGEELRGVAFRQGQDNVGVILPIGADQP